MITAPIYLLFNKPYGVLCQFTDEEGRSTLKDFINIPGVYPVGRLDMDSEGLLLLTNDGIVNNRIADPKNKLPKTYLAQVEGAPNENQLQILRKGVMIAGIKTLPAKAELIDEPVLWERPKPVRVRKNIPTSWIKIQIVEGRNRQVRKMTASAGLPCLRLVSTAIGKMTLDNLAPGEYKQTEI